MNKYVKTDSKNRIYMAIFNAIYIIIIFIALLYLLFNYVYLIKEVEETSMQPLLNPTGNNTDIVYVNRFDTDIDYGDIVVVHNDKEDIVKRVLGLPGDTIDIIYNTDNNSYMLNRNGEYIDEPYIKINATDTDPTGMYEAHINFDKYKNNNPDKLTLVDGIYKYILGENEIFLLGDNRHISLDSTRLGAYDIDNLLGTVEYIQDKNETNINIMFEYIFKLHWISTIINIFD